MDGAELDLNNTMLSPSPKTTADNTTITSSISTSDDYEKGIDEKLFLIILKQTSLDLQLAAELGRCLLERNQELQAYIGVLQKQIDDEQGDIKVKR